MKIKNVIAVSGEQGLYEIITTKNNGLILKEPKSGKVKFYSVRIHQFTPMETVGIYTWDDTAEVKGIFATMHSSLETLPVPSVKDDNAKLNTYFEQILPEYDRDRVYPSDIKKVIKWYNSMVDLGFIDASDEEE
jgi:hypothetical protein